MARITYFVALPFTEDEDGHLVPGEPAEAQSASSATSRARSLAERGAGALAFSRTGDPNIGEFDPAVILARFGRTPEELE